MNLKTQYLIILVVVFLAYACTNSESQQAGAQTELESDPASFIDPELSPLKVGTEFSRILADTLNIQMYVMTLNPGDSIDLHVHYDHAIYALQ